MTAAQIQPALFIGSSTEALPVARSVQAELERDLECTIWNQGVFGVGPSVLDALVQTATTTDFALLVVHADDMVDARGSIIPAPRDNVIFELGLFMGSIGPDRTYFLFNRNNSPKLPSDISGVVALTYGDRSDGNLRAAVAPACSELRSAALRLGIRPEKRLGELGAAQLLFRANNAAKQGDSAEALDLCERALTLDQSDAQIHITKIAVLRRLGRYDEALSAAKIALASFQRHPGLLYARAYTLWSCGKYEEAIEGFDQVLESQLGEDEVQFSSAREQKSQFLKARSLEALGRLLDAQRHYQLLVDVAPKSRMGQRARDQVIVLGNVWPSL